MKVKNWRSPMGWGVATGVLFATSYPPFPAWALFFAFAPLWIGWLRAKTFKEVILAGFIAQFTFNLIGFNWVAHTAIEYGHIPVFLSFLILIGFCCIASLQVVAVGFVSKWIQRKWNLAPIWFFALVAIVSGAGDWLYPTIFPWNTGYPLLFNKFHSAQLAEYLGFNLLGTLVYLSNTTFALSFVRFPSKGWSRPLLVFVFCLFISEMLGTYVENQVPVPDKSVSALLIQPNIGNYDKFVAERGNGYQEPVVRKDFAITEAGLQAATKKPEIIIWPETAYPENLDPWFATRHYAMEIQKFVEAHGLPLITGSYSEDDVNVRNRKDYNAVFAIQPHTPFLPGYRKQILLAFGEYFPGAQYFPFLKNLIPEISDFGRGDGPKAFNVNGVRYLPLICYEGLDTLYVRKVVWAGGHIFVNVTNDSWFGAQFEPIQHMIMTIARSVEYRRPFVRVTNTGYTVVSDAKGHIINQGPLGTEWTTVVDVPYSTSPPFTFFSKIAPFISVIFLILALGVVLLGRYLSDKQRT